MLGPLVELSGYHGGGDVLAAAIDGELAARLGGRDGDVGQADGAADDDARAAAGDGADDGGLAGAERAVDDGVAVARDRAGVVGDLEAGELASEAARLLVAQRLRAEELAVELDGPAQAGLERGVVVVEIVAVERQPGLEAQRVARAQADRQAARREVVDERAP